MKKLLFSIVFIPLFLFGEVSKEKYQIKLDRPIKKGESYLFTASFKEEVTTKAFLHGTALLDEVDIKNYNISGKVKVIGIVPKKLELTIISFNHFISGKEEEVLPKNSIVTIVHDHEVTKYKLKGGQLTERVIKYLEEFFTLDEELKDDQKLGSKSLKKIGESWPIKQEYIKDVIDSVDQKPEAFMKLRDKRVISGVECLNIVGTIKSKGVSIPLPPESSIKAGTAEVSFGADYPVDINLPKLSEFFKLKISISANVPTEKGDAAFTFTLLSSSSFNRSLKKN